MSPVNRISQVKLFSVFLPVCPTNTQQDTPILCEEINKDWNWLGHRSGEDGQEHKEHVIASSGGDLGGRTTA